MSDRKILVLGAGGMLGHKLYQILGLRFPEVWGTLRGSRSEAPFANSALFGTDRVIDGVDVTYDAALEDVFNAARPDVVVNCVGTIKQRPEAEQPVQTILTNALLPHRLNELCQNLGTRLIHISTDCVFNGTRGMYREDDPTDADDLYGKTKALGEVSGTGAITLRTSIIGRELRHHQSLLEWFLAQNRSVVQGYTRVYWSGVTTLHLSELIADIIAKHPTLEGLYNVATPRMSKYELLILLRTAFDLDVEIVPDDRPTLDRSLNGERLQAAIGYAPPAWDTLSRLLANDSNEAYQ